jgi:hypothetical protein
MDIPTSLPVLIPLSLEGLAVLVPKLQSWGLVATKLLCPKCGKAELVPWRGRTASHDNQARCVCDNYGTVITWDAGSVFDHRTSRIPLAAKLCLLYTFALSFNCKQATEALAEHEGILPDFDFSQRQAQAFYNIIRGFVSRYVQLTRHKLGGPAPCPFVAGEKGVTEVANPNDPSGPVQRVLIVAQDESEQHRQRGWRG